MLSNIAKHYYNYKKMYQNILEFLKYTMVGGLAFLVDFTTLNFFEKYLHVYYLISALIGFCFGLSLNYILSKKWVFSSTNQNGIYPFIQFTVIGIIGLVITELGMWIGVGIFAINLNITKFFLTGIVFMWNYVARKILVFKT